MTAEAPTMTEQQERFGYKQTDMTGACLINEHAGCLEIDGRCVCNCHKPVDLTAARDAVIEAAKRWYARELSEPHRSMQWPDTLEMALIELERLERGEQP